MPGYAARRPPGSGIAATWGARWRSPQQEQPVKNGIPQYPVFIPLSTADAIQVLADGPHGVSRPRRIDRHAAYKTCASLRT
jgi:hypothetical protein